MIYREKTKIIDWLDLHSLEVKSPCKNKQIGAFLLAPSGQIVGTGYNMTIGKPCACVVTGRCPRHSVDTPAYMCPAIHGEVAAILDYLHYNADLSTLTNTQVVDTLILEESLRDKCKGYFIYCSYSPCPDCMRLCEYLGIEDVFFVQKHRKTQLSKKLNLWKVSTEARKEIKIRILQ